MKRAKGIDSAVIALILIVAILLGVMCPMSGCSADQALSIIHGDSADTLPTQTAVSAADVSSADIADEPEVTIPTDHEDVIFANYISDYYIVVYTLNNSVLVLKKDEHGKYTQTVKCFLCSAGAFETPTENGVYDIVEKHLWRYMMYVYGRYCTRIGEGTGYLFHSVPYNRENDIQSQINGYDNLGQNASHGCIRLCVRDAKWIYDNIPYETQVHIVDGKNGPEGEPVPMRIKEDKYWGWDPTDTDPRNPYLALDPSELTYFTHTSANTEATTVATVPAG